MNLTPPKLPQIKMRQRGGAVPRVSFNHILPNAITLLSLCAGLSAVRFAMMGKWEQAIFAVLASAICDTLDGRLARLLKATSQFGAELDSLADAIAFGVAPAFMLYLWSLQQAGALGWVAVLGFACCAALRLARFNTALTAANQPSFAAHFFTGVPTPAAAGLAIFPIILSQGLQENGWGSLVNLHWLLVPWVLMVAGLMVSRIPTYSFKKMKVSRDFGLVILLGVALFAALVMTMPWLALSLVLLCYMGSIPLAVWHYRLMTKAELEKMKQAGESA